MNVEFTSNEINVLFEFALQNRQSEAAGLALKVAYFTNSDPSSYLIKALENSNLYHFAIVNGLAQFARYDQINLILKLLECNSSKVKLITIACLELLKDPSSLEKLDQLALANESGEIKEKANTAYEKISKQPIALRNNTFYTFKKLTALQEEDLCYAEFILNRAFSSKNIEVLVKLLSHPVKDLRCLSSMR